MTPKEKAQKLFDKYFLLQESATDKNGNWFVIALNKGLAKKCASIAVDEIINSKPAITDSQIEYKNYWQEVKTEIERL
jgi:hypothetical protein